LSARTPREAVAAFLTPLRQAIACVTDAQLAGGSDPAKPHALFFRPSEGGYIRLRGLHPLQFRLSHNYEIVQDTHGWSAHTRGYAYELQLADGREVVAYHYDPRPQSKVKVPHLHIKGLTTPLALEKAHFPTGRVPIEAVLRFAVTELGVQPRVSEWEAVLAGLERDFNAQRTW